MNMYRYLKHTSKSKLNEKKTPPPAEFSRCSHSLVSSAIISRLSPVLLNLISWKWPMKKNRICLVKLKWDDISQRGIIDGVSTNVNITDELKINLTFDACFTFQILPKLFTNVSMKNVNMTNITYITMAPTEDSISGCLLSSKKI